MSLSRLHNIAQQAPSEDRAWLLACIERYQSGEQLEVALGLCGSAALVHRNLLLKKAAHILNVGDEYSITCVAGMLEAAILRFECRVLPKYRKNSSIELSEIDTIFFEMFELNCRIVRKKRQLFDLIA